MPGRVPEAQPAWLSCQAEQSMGREVPRQSTATSIWSAESAGKPRLSASPQKPAHGNEEQGLQHEPSTLQFEQPKYDT